MDTELRKRLEEAAEETLNCTRCSAPKHGECKYRKDCHSYQVYIKAAELGYNEAIAQAKKWWKNHYKLPDYYHSETRDVQEEMRDDYEFHMKVVADFEAEMLKLWEEKK